MQHTWTQESINDNTYYIIQECRGCIYSICNSLEDAYNCVDYLKKYGDGNEITVIEAKNILHLKDTSNNL